MKSYIEFFTEQADDGKRPINMKKSEHDMYHVHLTMNHHRSVGSELKTVDVHPSKLRATQDEVHKNFDPKVHNSDKHSINGNSPVHGIRTEDGNVHLLDGHHRGDHAISNGHKSIKVQVYDHHGPLKTSMKQRGGKMVYE